MGPQGVAKVGGGEPGFWETDKGNLKTARLTDLGRQPGDSG